LITFYAIGNAIFLKSEPKDLIVLKNGFFSIPVEVVCFIVWLYPAMLLFSCFVLFRESMRTAIQKKRGTADVPLFHNFIY